MRTIAGAAGAILLVLIAVGVVFWNPPLVYEMEDHLDAINLEVERQIGEVQRQASRADRRFREFEGGLDDFDRRLSSADRALDAHTREWGRVLEREWREEWKAFGRDVSEIAEGLHAHVSAPIWREELHGFRNELRESVRHGLRDIRQSIQRELREFVR